MKSKLKGIGVILFIVFVLSLIFDEEPKKTVTNKVNNEEGITQVEEASKKTAEDNKKKEEKEIQDYMIKMTGFLERFTVAMGDFSTLNRMVEENPSMLFDDGWRAKLAEVLNEWSVILDEISAVEPPHGVEKPHELILKAVDEYYTVVEIYPLAVESFDTNLFQQCIDAMGAGSYYLNQASEEFSKF